MFYYNIILKSLSFFLIILLFIFNIFASSNNNEVLILVPLEHEAMNQIVSGIKESLNDINTKITVKNAQGDPNIMQALIKQINKDTSIIMPIRTSSCQATISHSSNNIICIASFPMSGNNKSVTGICDEIPITSSLQKLDKIKNIGIIYSASEKITPEIEEVKKYAQANNIKLHLRMIQNLIDLPTIVKSLPSDIQAFLILKDHLVVSGINIINKEAIKRSIPVIASDECSDVNGATIAIGVKEKDIGINGGLIAKKILGGISPIDIPFESMKKLTLFINIKAFEKQNILTKEDIEKISLSKIEINK